MEAPPGIGPGMKVLQTSALPLGYGAELWSGLRGSNPPPPPWQGGALPNELNPHKWCLRSESNQRHEDFQSSALPTELQRRIGGAKNGDSDGARLSRELRAQSFAALTVSNCHSLPLLLLAPSSQTKKHSLWSAFCSGADYGARTRHLHLGKVALYQMS